MLAGAYDCCPAAHTGSASSTPRQVPGTLLHATEAQPSELEQAGKRRQEGRLLAEREQLLAQVLCMHWLT
jgi:hypothetical protein